MYPSKDVDGKLCLGRTGKSVAQKLVHSAPVKAHGKGLRGVQRTGSGWPQQSAQGTHARDGQGAVLQEDEGRREEASSLGV